MRNKAIHALGHAREAWAVDLVVAALTEEATRAAAVEALAGLGDEALEILGGLIAAHDGHARLLGSCIAAAAGLDPVAAIELVLPLAWHDDPGVRLAASVLAAQRLAEGPVCWAFEAGEAIAWRGHEPDEPEAGTLAAWAVPWLEPGHRRARACYGQLIDNLAAPLRPAAEDPAFRQVLDRIPAVILIPTLIHAGSGAARRLAAADADARGGAAGLPAGGRRPGGLPTPGRAEPGPLVAGPGSAAAGRGGLGDRDGLQDGLPRPAADDHPPGRGGAVGSPLSVVAVGPGPDGCS